MSNLQVKEIVDGLNAISDALADSSSLPPERFKKKPAKELDPSKTTVAVYSDNLIRDPDLWAEKKATIDASVRRSRSQSGEVVGMEALAWYVSFHHDQKNWGIYIPVSSIHYLNEILEIKQNSNVDLDQISMQVLMQHEIYHYLNDLAVSQLELLTRHAMYRPHKKLYRLKTPRMASEEDYNELEENIANAFMLEVLQNLVSKNQLKQIISWVETMPRGYNDGVRTFLKSDKNFLENRNLNRYSTLAATKRQLNIIEPALDLSVLIPKSEEIIIGQCPLYILDDTDEHGLDEDIVRFFQKMDEIEETKRFKKMLSKVPQKIQGAWEKKKEQLKISIPKAPQFKRFKEYFSVRLPEGFRAHFTKPKKKETTWFAEEIGDHQSMGHGK